jgi:hypothetical protein
VGRKFSENNNKKFQVFKKSKIKFRNVIDENHIQMGVFKTAAKLNNKKCTT